MPPAPGRNHRPSLRWVMIALVFFATVINYMDRQTLSVVTPVLRQEFHMSNTVYSRVVFAFMLAYTISNGLSGPLIDRLGTRLGYALCITWWSVAAMLHSLATGPWTLGLFRFLLGIGEAGNWPAGVKVVAEWFPARERALASGIFNSGSSIGALIAPPLVAWLVLNYGWPSSFLLVGATGFLWLAFWLRIYFVPADVVQETREKPIPALTLIREPFIQRFTIAKLFLDPVWYFYIFWFPEYLKSARGFDLAGIGKFAWIPFLTADAGNLLGGWFSGLLVKRGVTPARARKVGVLCFASLMTSAIPAVLARDSYVSVGLVSVATLGYTGCLANMLAMPTDVYPKNAVASIWGLASLGSGFGGMVFSLATGWGIDHYGYPPVFFGFGVLPLICAAVTWWLPDRRASA